MKYFKILFFVLLFSAMDVSAQYGYGGYGNGYYRSNAGPGVIRDPRTAGMQQTHKEPTPEEIEKNRIERIDAYMSNLKTDLKLDDLQYIAVKNELVASSKKMDIVVKKEFSDDEKVAELKSIQEKTEKTILSYLNPAQKEKYALLKVEKPKLKDEKKKKKDKEKEKEKDKDPNE